MHLPPIYKRNGADCFLEPYKEKLIPVTPKEYVRQRVAIWPEKRLFVPNRVIIIDLGPGLMFNFQVERV